ncbi:alpha-(1,3)-fucosyltransferase C-like [Palaemon carinicauda]|uniref:alpha-(1,3)-fucosyltransferase C-like n=1 Tax=Palaemon carinicauda TaxID=392227 RepID=UPI0035B61C9E
MDLCSSHSRGNRTHAKRMQKKTVYILLVLCGGLCTFFLAFSPYNQLYLFIKNPISMSSYPHLSTFQDEAFAPLMDVFRKKAAGELDPELTRFRSGSIPRVLLWSKPLRRDFWNAVFSHVNKGQCPFQCEVSYDVEQRNTADAILIYMRGTKDSETVNKSLWPRDPTQPWVMVTLETPLYSNNVYKTNYENFNGFFNRTLTYRRDSDVVFNHGFVVTKKESSILPRSWVIPPVTEVKNHTRKLAVAFISNCHALSNRLMYIHRVQEYAQVDVYGNCGSLKCGHSMYVEHRYNTTTDPCLKDAGEGYSFFFAFENNFCKDYLTEKVYNLLHYPIVPVVRGSANYYSLLPPNSFIDANNYSPKELAERLLYLEAHPKEYEKYFEWKNHYQASTVGGERIMCHLCSRLHESEFYEHKVYKDFEDWFVSKSNCMAGIKL